MRRTLGFALAAGVLTLLPASSARAQSSYGYDSLFYNLPASEPYWYSAGFSGVYTDGTTNSFAAPAVAPMRSLAPNGQPPYSAFGQGNGLVNPGVAQARVPAVSRAPAQSLVRQPVKGQPQRRTLFGRARRR